jgi:hypothetical protein
MGGWYEDRRLIGELQAFTADLADRDHAPEQASRGRRVKCNDRARLDDGALL